ncbi:MAG TPA: tannase/feruloyl esterase family alpha/beta hydrolase [Steroidobacteraceae bacterium]
MPGSRVLHLLWVAVLLSAATNASASPADFAARCAALRAPHIAGLSIEQATVVPAGPATLGGAPGAQAQVQLPAHCLFQGTLGARTGAQGQHLGIGIELRLPMQWNGRFLFQGGGGLDGVLGPSYGLISGTHFAPALSRGYAVVATDGGHRSPSLIDPHFALDQQARLDYGYNALDQTTSIAKQLISRFYGSAPTHSYFIGCSNGGRQAMMVAQRLPLEFDGVVAGDPSFRLTRTNIDEAWNEIVLARAAPKDARGRPIISEALSPADLQLVSAAVLKQCDALDGLADGMINDFRACRFDPAVLTCPAAKTPQCLSAPQVTALKALMSGPHDSQGRQLYAAFPYDAGISSQAYYRMHFGTSIDGVPNSADATLGFDTLRYLAFTPPDPSFDVFRFDFDRDVERTAEGSKIIDADAVNLNSFAAHAKLILYHGLSDQGLSPLDTVSWYEHLAPSSPGAVRDWARLFLVPGMTHCAGGPATDQFDTLTAIVDWVEKGQAPERIVARGDSFPGVTRPLCAYPQVARYGGGDAHRAASFQCRR